MFFVLAALAVAALLKTDPPARPRADPLPPGCVARFGDARLRHPGRVESMAFTPDGKQLATTTPADAVVRVWDVATAELVRELPLGGGADSVTLVGFAPDGRRLLAVRRYDKHPNNFGREWCEPAVVDAETGAAIGWGWGKNSRYDLPALTISPDGRTVAGVDSARVRVWDFDTGREVRMLARVARFAHQVAGGVCFSPDGTQVAVGTDDRAVHVGPADGNRPLRRIDVDHKGRGVRSVFWPRPDRLVALWYDGLAAIDPEADRVIDVRDHPLKNMIAEPRAAGGDTLFVKNDRGYHGQAVDLSTLEAIPGRTFPCGWRYAPVAATADGRVVAFGCGRAVRLYGAAVGLPLHPDLDRQPAEPAERMEVSADGRRMLTAGDGAAQTWDMPDGRLLAAFGSGGMGQAANWTLSADGRRVAGGFTADWAAVVWDAATGGETFRDRVGEGPPRLVLGFAGGNRVWAKNINKSEVVALGPMGANPGVTLPEYSRGARMTSSPDGRRLAATGFAGLAIRDTDPSTPWVELENHRDREHPDCGSSPSTRVVPVRFSPDGRYLLVWDDGHVLWDVAGAPRRVGRLSTGRVGEWSWVDGSFVADGRRVAAVVRGEDGRAGVRVWESATGNELRRPDVPGDATGVAFTPDGRRLVVAHPDTTFSVWDYAGP
jgi:WD40 repeat protein